VFIVKISSCLLKLRLANVGVFLRRSVEVVFIVDAVDYMQVKSHLAVVAHSQRNDVTRINFRFRFWSHTRGRVASFYQILCKYLHPVYGDICILRNSIWSPYAILDLLKEVMRPPTKAHSMHNIHC